MASQDGKNKLIAAWARKEHNLGMPNVKKFSRHKVNLSYYHFLMMIIYKKERRIEGPNSRNKQTSMV